MSSDQLPPSMMSLPTMQPQPAQWLVPPEHGFLLPSDASTTSEASMISQVPSGYDLNGNPSQSQATSRSNAPEPHYAPMSYLPNNTLSHLNLPSSQTLQNPRLHYDNHLLVRQQQQQGFYPQLHPVHEALPQRIPNYVLHDMGQKDAIGLAPPIFESENRTNSYSQRPTVDQTSQGFQTETQYQSHLPTSTYQSGPTDGHEIRNQIYSQHQDPSRSNLQLATVHQAHQGHLRRSNTNWQDRQRTSAPSTFEGGSIRNLGTGNDQQKQSMGHLREVSTPAPSYQTVVPSTPTSQTPAAGTAQDRYQTPSKPRSRALTHTTPGSHRRLTVDVGHHRQRLSLGQGIPHIQTLQLGSPTSGQISPYSLASTAVSPSTYNYPVSSLPDSNSSSLCRVDQVSQSQFDGRGGFPSPVSAGSNAIVSHSRNATFIEDYTPPTMAQAFPHGPAAQQFGPTNTAFAIPGDYGYLPSTHLLSLLPNGDTSLVSGITNDGIPTFNVRRDGPVPNIDLLFHSGNMPFIETARQFSPVEYGVVRLSGIPYNVTRAEVMAFFGRSAKLVNDSEEPVHIIMERVTSKTMDAFVEFVNIGEAANAVSRYENSRLNGRGGRLGERHIDMELSSQDLFLKEMFPKAKNVEWQKGRPIVHPTDPHDNYNSGFKGFVSSEELVMLCKHVENPHRSPFSKDCPQRPFECLISTLLKFPWYMVDHITIQDRYLIYTATITLLRVLQMRVDQKVNVVHLNEQLLRRVRRAAIRCPGFSETMRDNICHLLNYSGACAGLPMYANIWPFQVIGAKRNFSRDVLWYYVNLLRLGTTSAKQITLAEQSAQGRLEKHVHEFGHTEVNYPSNARDMTLAQIAVIEWGVIENILRTFVGS